MNKKQGKPLKMRLFFFLVTHIDGNPAAPDMHDIGILASLDPIALDQACVDLVYAALDGRSLIEIMESRNGIHTLDYAEEIGVGSQSYELISVD